MDGNVFLILVSQALIKAYYFFGRESARGILTLKSYKNLIAPTISPMNQTWTS